jgi:hypothetical protein
MHARVAAFENREMSRVDDLVQILRERAGGEEPVPGALAMYMLIDRFAGTALGVSLFENEEAIKTVEPEFERLGDEIPEELRGRRTSVDIFEVALHEVAEGGAKAARISNFTTPTDAIDEMFANAEQNILPEAREIDGWKGAIGLVDRRTGASKLITLWESTEALHASELLATELRERSAQHAGGTIGSIERFEVPLMFDRAPKLAAH